MKHPGSYHTPKHTHDGNAPDPRPGLGAYMYMYSKGHFISNLFLVHISKKIGGFFSKADVISESIKEPCKSEKKP